MTEIHHTDIVIYEVALCEHPLVVGEDDDRTDEELIKGVEERTETSDDLNWPEWAVFVDDPPDMETIRYVNTASRINVRGPYGIGGHKKDRDVFDEIIDRIEIEGWDISQAEFSHWGPTHPNDFEGVVHLDLTE